MAFNYLQQHTDTNSPQCINRLKPIMRIDRRYLCDIISWLSLVELNIL